MLVFNVLYNNKQTKRELSYYIIFFKHISSSAFFLKVVIHINEDFSNFSKIFDLSKKILHKCSWNSSIFSILTFKNVHKKIQYFKLFLSKNGNKFLLTCHRDLPNTFFKTSKINFSQDSKIHIFGRKNRRKAELFVIKLIIKQAKQAIS